MKISVDDEELYTLSETQKKVIRDYVKEEEFEADMKRRLEWILMHLYDESFKLLKKNWEPILASRGVESIPTNRDQFAELVFSQPDYKNRSQRDAEGVETE